MFLEYQNPREAAEAVKNADGYKLDKQHTFQVNLFTDFDKYASIPDEWEPPMPQPYKDPVRPTSADSIYQLELDRVLLTTVNSRSRGTRAAKTYFVRCSSV